jgi:hypothetical protein
MLETAVTALFLVVMLAPWVFFAQKMSGARIPFWSVGIAALLLGAVMQRMFGANASYYIGYYGAIAFGLGIVAAAFAYFNGRAK